VSKSEDLTKIDRNIKDCENRLKTFGSNIDTIQKEVDFLVHLESQLETNISFLKKIKIVALASEYKKAREDLKKTKTKLVQLKSDKTINEKAYKELEFMLQKNKEVYDKLAKQSENNVLLGKFGKKRV
jgi:chromosome segregation ATPase